MSEIEDHALIPRVKRQVDESKKLKIIYFVFMLPNKFYHYLSLNLFSVPCSLDLVFVLDESGSITAGNFEKMKDFCISVVERIEIGSSSTHVALVKYGDDATIIFDLSEGTDKDDIIQQIRDMPYGGGRTHTASALRLCREDIFDTSNGDRPSATNAIIILTDGASTDESPIAEARKLHDDGVEVMSVGIGSGINEDELSEISSPDHLLGVNYFLAADFDELVNVLDSLLSLCDIGCE